MFFIGIDLSDKFLDSCMVDSATDVLARSRFDFTNDGFCSFIQHIQEHGVDNQNCIIGLENPRSTMVDFLIQRGYTVLLANPYSIAKYRESRSPSRAKSDQADAQYIADYIREHYKTIRPISIPDERIRELSILLEDRDRLVQQKVRLSNQMVSTLKEYFPQAVKAFGSVTNKCALRFLKEVDTFQQAKALGHKDMEQLLDNCHCYRADSREMFHEAMKETPFRIPQEIVRTKTRLKNVLVKQLYLLIEEIEEYDRQIQDVMGNIPHGDIFTSLPGADYILGAKILVLYASRNFQTASEVGALYGTSPYTARSGRNVCVRFRWGCNKRGRTTFHQLARCSISKSQWAKRQFTMKRSQGKKFHHAVRCLSNLWVKVTFAMWRDKIPYDEEKHFASFGSHVINQPVRI